MLVGDKSCVVVVVVGGGRKAKVQGEFIANIWCNVKQPQSRKVLSTMAELEMQEDSKDGWECRRAEEVW